MKKQIKVLGIVMNQYKYDLISYIRGLRFVVEKKIVCTDCFVYFFLLYKQNNTIKKKARQIE
jgi:hypothetical protein